MLRNAYSNAESIKFVRLGITTKRPEYIHFNLNLVDWIGDMVMQALWPMCEFEACARVVLYEGQEHHGISHIGTVRGDQCGTRKIRDAQSSHFSHYMGYRTQVTLLLSIVHAYVPDGGETKA